MRDSLRVRAGDNGRIENRWPSGRAARITAENGGGMAPSIELPEMPAMAEHMH
jgi:hypothetical protein